MRIKISEEFIAILGGDWYQGYYTSIPLSEVELIFDNKKEEKDFVNRVFKSQKMVKRLWKIGSYTKQMKKY